MPIEGKHDYPGNHRGRHNPREAAMTWEADRSRNQKPTLFSSPNAFKRSARVDWMQGGSGRSHDAPTREMQRERKARITLAKVWRD